MMQPTTKLRWIKRKMKVDPAFNVYNGHPTETVLQQWWEDEYETVYLSSTSTAKTIREGKWRDIPIEEQS